MSKFNRIANVQFAINGEDQTVTVSNLPYVWDDLTAPMDQQAIFDACNYLRRIGVQRGLSVVWVETSPAPVAADCPECSGKGYNDFDREEADGFVTYKPKCTNCKGTGKIEKTEEDYA